MIRRIFAAQWFLLAALCVAAPVQACPGGDAIPQNAGDKLSLSAQASTQVAQDISHITLFYEQQGNDPASLTSTLKQKTDQALRTAKSQSKVSVRTGVFNVYPTTDRDNRIKGWRGRTELVLESTDFAAISQLAGRLSPIMQVSAVRFSLSPKARQETQAKLANEAIAAFREQAKSAAQAFGYNNYAVVDVNVQQNGIGIPEPMMMATFSSARAADSEIPLEAGKTTVNVSVSGTVRMLH